jgi:hypothetical protein
MQCRIANHALRVILFMLFMRFGFYLGFMRRIQVFISFGMAILILLFLPEPTSSQDSKKTSLVGSASLVFASNDGFAMLGSGFHIKLIMPLNSHGDALTTGLDSYIIDYFDTYDVSSEPFIFITGTLGYRKKIRSLYIEPQLGGGYYRDEEYYLFMPHYTPTPCGAMGVECGIEKKRLCYSVDYRFISSGQFIKEDIFHTFSIKVGYRFF